MKNERFGLLRGLAGVFSKDATSDNHDRPPPQAGQERPSSHHKVREFKEGSELLDIVQIGKSHPCHRCPAPCCRLVLHDEKTPTSYMEIDYIRFTLLHGRAELIISRQNQFAFGYWSSCRNLDEGNYSCKVHGTDAQPKTCNFYNPYNCYYKRNFVGNVVSDVLRFNLERFKVWAKELMFDENGLLIFMPTFERSIELVSHIPVTPDLQMLPDRKEFAA